MNTSNEHGQTQQPFVIQANDREASESEITVFDIKMEKKSAAVGNYDVYIHFLNCRIV